MCIVIDALSLMLIFGMSYRSFDYCFTWKIPMYPRRSSRLKRGSKEEFQGSPSPSEGSIHHKQTKKQKGSLKKTKINDSGADTDDERDRDILDIIGSSRQKHVEEEKGWRSGVVNKGGESSDEDCDSVSSSISSGPSVPHSSSRKQRPWQSLCSACWNLYQRAKEMNAPILNKLLDNGEWMH